MPPKRTSKRTVAAVSSSQAAAAADMAGGADPGSFQLPPYREDSPTLWFDYAEGLMDMRRITNPYFRATLVQQALTYAQQDAIAGVLLRKKEVGAYELIKNELLRLHEKDEWTRMRELLNIKSLGGQRGTELLSSMEKLAPQDNSLWLKFLFFSALPSSMQDLLAEEKGTARQLAAWQTGPGRGQGWRCGFRRFRGRHPVLTFRRAPPCGKRTNAQPAMHAATRSGVVDTIFASCSGV